MKSKLSESTEKLIESLHLKRKFWDSIARPDPQPELIQQIADAGEPAAIPDLLPILLTANRTTTLACAGAIHHLVQKLKPAEFVRFDEFVRQGYSDWQVRREPWYVLKPRDVGHLATMGAQSVSLLGITSCHLNGFVREEAIRELGKTDNGTELPFLLIRLNDWVAAVRAMAKKLVFERIKINYVHHLLSWLPLVVRLSKASREDHSSIVEEVRRLFENPEARPALFEGFKSQDLFVRRFCFQLALNAMSPNDATVLDRASNEGDSLIRYAAVRKLSVLLPTHPLGNLLLRARNDAYMPVRREALHIYAEKYPDQARREFETALLDPNIAIREEAQHFFRKKDFDLLSFYSRAIHTSKSIQLYSAIAGIGETGSPKDAEMIERFVLAPSTKLRVAALHAMARLNPNAYLEQFLRALEDANGKVAREGAISLTKKVNSVGGQRLWEIYKRCRSPLGKRSTLFLISRLTKWDSICFLIPALEDQDASLVELSRKYVERWFARYNRSFIAPSREQVSNLRGILSQYGLLTSSGIQKQLESLLKSF